MLLTCIHIGLIIVSVLMIIVILLQPSNSDGFSSAISGGAEQLFGKKRSDAMSAMLQRITTVCASIFFALTVVALVLS